MWLFGAAADRPEVAGWLPRDAVRGTGDLTRLTRVEAATGGVAPTQTAGSQSRSGPRPDLALQAVGSKQDRLSVIVSNVGGADFSGAILVSVNGGSPTRWNIGTTHKVTFSGVPLPHTPEARALCMMVPCVCMQPLGKPVVPLV